MAEFFKFEFKDGAKIKLNSEVVKGVPECLVLTHEFVHHGKKTSLKTPLTDTDTKEDFSGKLAGAILRAHKELGKETNEDQGDK